jgi:hypothetical protein
MKNKKLFYILRCMISFISILGCEKAEIQGTSNSQNNKVSARMDECDDCPVEDCCCAIELRNVSIGTANLRICGTSDGTGSCSYPSPPSPCIAISGGGQATGLLNSSDPKHLFCMDPGNSLCIENLSSSPADIWLTCQNDIVMPQRIAITIPANETVCFATNGSCEVELCD